MLGIQDHVIVDVKAYSLEHKILFKDSLAVRNVHGATGLAKSYVRAFIKDHPNPAMRQNLGWVEAKYRMKDGERVTLSVVPADFTREDYGVL